VSDNPHADQAWRMMAAVVFDNRDTWRREVLEATGLAFSRVRVLRRLAKRSMTAKQTSAAATMDAPATNRRGQRPAGAGTGCERGGSDQPAVQAGVAHRRGPHGGRVHRRGGRSGARPFAALSEVELHTLRAILAKPSSG
jgi:hypothetical protein